MSANPISHPTAAVDIDALFALITAGVRYDDSVRWFDSNQLHFVETIDRGSKLAIHVFVYEPTGRHLFADERGRTYRFSRPSDPSKSVGNFTLEYGRHDGIANLRPPSSAPMTLEPGAAFRNDDLFSDIDDLPCSTGCYGDGMRREITQRELRNQSGEIMRALEAGDEFVVTRNGVPVGELRPFRRRQFTPTADFLEEMRGAPAVDFRQLRADLEAVASYEVKPPRE